MFPAARLLVAAGHHPMRLWLGAVLRREGFDPTTAATGRAALREAYARTPALVLLDHSLREPGVWETLDRLRDFSEVPALVLLDGPADEERALLAGADDAVFGPLDDLRVLARVRTLLRRHTET